MSGIADHGDSRTPPPPTKEHRWDARWTPEQMTEAEALAQEAAIDASRALDRACREVAAASDDWTRAEKWLATVKAFRVRADG